MSSIRAGVGFLVGAGIPKGQRSQTFIECGCCGAYHRADFWGDCREDGERFADVPPEARRVIDLEEQREGGER